MQYQSKVNDIKENEKEKISVSFKGEMSLCYDWSRVGNKSSVCSLVLL